MSQLTQISVEKCQRGPSLKLAITVVTVVGENIKPDNGVGTGIINVSDNVLVSFKFNWYSTIKINNLIQPYVGVRQNTSVNNSNNCTDEVVITCEKFKKSIYCADVWLEAPMISKKYDCCKTSGTGSSAVSTLLYSFKVDVTVKRGMPKPLLINSKLYEDIEFTDFQLHTTDGSVAVHRAMLALHSDIFKTLLIEEWKDSAEGHINMDGVTVQTLQDLKDYMYLGALPDKGLEKLLLVAVHYSMDKLKSECIAKLVSSVTPETFEGILEFACQGSILLELVRALIYEIPEDILNDAHHLKKLRAINI